MIIEDTQYKIKASLHEAAKKSTKWGSVKTVKFKQLLAESRKHLKKDASEEKAINFLMRLNEFHA